MDVVDPVSYGTSLASKMREQSATTGQVVVWPLGQAGFRLSFPGCTVYIDLYLSNHCEAVLPRPYDHRRRLLSPLDPAQLTDADLVLCTHEHLDHTDWPTIRTLALASPTSRLVTPATNAESVLALDWPRERLIESNAGQTIRLGEIEIRPFAVPHDDYEESPLGFPYQGYAISDGHITIVHVGDARLDDALLNTLQGFAIDLLLVPINGRSPSRKSMGFAGNMNAAEACQLASKVNARFVAPMHFDMFEQNTDPDALTAFNLIAGAQDDFQPMVVPVGESFTIESEKKG